MPEIERLAQEIKAIGEVGNEFRGQGPLLIPATISSVDEANHLVGVTLPSGSNGSMVNTGTVFPVQGTYVPEVGHEILILMHNHAPVIFPPASTIPTAPPGAVSGVTVTPGIQSLLIEWAALVASNVKWNRGYYQVQVDTVNTFDSVNLISTDVAASSTVISSLVTGTLYYVRVRGVTYQGTVGTWSSIGSGTPITIEAPDLGSIDLGVPSVATLVGLDPTDFTPPQYVVYLSTNQKLYRWDGVSAWTAAVPTVDLTGTIATAQIATDAITATLIAAGAVGSSELASSSVIAGKIAAGSIVAADIAALTITASQIAANTITAAKVAAGTLTATEIAAGTITGDRMVAGTITATQIAALGITTGLLAANAVTAAKIAAGTITATEIAANTITAGKIAAATITATELAANSVTATQLAALNIAVGKYIRSTSYVASTSGWSIDADGTAEFNNVIVRGRVIAASITAGQITAIEGAQILTNPGFETNTTGWAAGANTTISRDTGTKRTGTASLKLTPTSSPNPISATTPTGTSGFAVEAGASYQARGWFRGSPAESSRVTLTWYNAAGTLISSVSSPDLSGSAPTWTAPLVVGTAPALAAFASIEVRGDAGVGGIGAQFVDDAFFAKSSSMTGAAFFSASEGQRTSIDSSGVISLYPGRETALPAQLSATVKAYGIPVNDSTLVGDLTITSPSPTSDAAKKTTVTLRSDSVDGAVESKFSVSTDTILLTADKIAANLVSGTSRLNLHADTLMAYNSGAVQVGSLHVLLGRKYYDTESLGSNYFLSTHILDLVDGTNLIVPFIAPASGEVIVVFSGFVTQGTGNGHHLWYVDIAGGSGVAANSRVYRAPLLAGNSGLCVARFNLIGLTAGVSYTARWAWRLRQSGDANVTLYKGTDFGGLLMEVYGVMS